MTEKSFPLSFLDLIPTTIVIIGVLLALFAGELPPPIGDRVPETTSVVTALVTLGYVWLRVGIYLRSKMRAGINIRIQTLKLRTLLGLAGMLTLALTTGLVGTRAVTNYWKIRRELEGRPPIECSRSFDPAHQTTVFVTDFVQRTGDPIDVAGRLYDEIASATEIDPALNVCRAKTTIEDVTRAQRVGQTDHVSLVIWFRQDAASLDIHFQPTDTPDASPTTISIQLEDFNPQLGYLFTAYALSQVSFRQGRYIEAIRMLKQGINGAVTHGLAENHLFAEPYFFLGQLYEYAYEDQDNKLQGTELAVKPYIHAKELDPEMYSVYFSLAYAYRTLKQYDLAAKLYKDLFDVTPLIDVEAHRDYASMLAEKGECDEAQAAFDVIIRTLDPIEGHGGQGQIHLGGPCVDTERAIEDYQALIKLVPDDPMNYFYLGLAQVDAGRCDDALQTYAQAKRYLTSVSRDTIIGQLESILEISDLQPDELQCIRSILSALRSP